jgi:hypothetical protein
VGLFTLGAMSGAVVTGSTLAALAFVVQPAAGFVSSGIAVGLIGLVLAITDFRFRPFGVLRIRRQTCPNWFRRFGPKRAWLLWGFDLGLGFSTIRVCSLYWMLLLFVVAFLPPILAPAVLALYGLTLALSLAATALTERRHPEYASPGLGLLQAAGRVQVLGSTTLVVVSLIVLSAGASQGLL